MKTEKLFLRELDSAVSGLKGIGKALKSELKALEILTVADLLSHFPRSYEDRKSIKTLSSVPVRTSEGVIVNTVAEIIGQSYIGWGSKKTLKVFVRDNTGTGTLVCFGRSFLSRVLIPGRKFFLYGKFVYRYGEFQCSDFDMEPISGEPKLFGRILPVYPLAGKITQKFLRKIMLQALKEHADRLEDELPHYLLKEYNLLSKREALKQIHFPDDFKLLEKARKTLVYEELFHLQLQIWRRALKRRSCLKAGKKLSFKLKAHLLQRLPFKLTEDQQRVFSEICKDMADPKPMARLLQGDVGCGKTLVAFLAALVSIEAGYQVAFMAPTELLARQHAENAAELLSPLGVRLAFLSGNVSGERRSTILKALAEGEVNMLVGTHALFTEQVRFRSLGLVIVDEQQRFGVLQRLALTGTGEMPDLLLLSATPIPRSLALTFFGDLDVSTIKTMPEGRKPVITHLTVEGNEEKVYKRVREEIEKGRQAYFVYPLIAQSDKLGLKDAESMFHTLREDVFPDFSLGLIHSRIPEEEKESTMVSFIKGEIDILVSTSVVEVGVDVSNATCMVVECAERFGLSALHQLRGRVGRGEHQSYAFLVYSRDLTEEGKRRLKIMKKYHDGFIIAEEDLKLRGPGEITGTTQSGFFRLKIADIASDLDVLQQAREDAVNILRADPGFILPEHSLLREVFSRVNPFAGAITEGG